MKIKKLIVPLALLFSALFFSNAEAKSFSGLKLREVSAFKSMKQLNVTEDSITLTCFLSDNTPADWTVTLYGSNGQGSFTFNVNAATFATGVLGKIPRGMYAIEFQCNDYPVPDLEMDFYSDSWTATAYLGGGQDYTHIPQAYISSNDTYAEIDFGPWIH
jgi:hypothetical protein